MPTESSIYDLLQEVERQKLASGWANQHYDIGAVDVSLAGFTCKLHKFKQYQPEDVLTASPFPLPSAMGPSLSTSGNINISEIIAGRTADSHWAQGFSYYCLNPKATDASAPASSQLYSEMLASLSVDVLRQGLALVKELGMDFAMRPHSDHMWLIYAEGSHWQQPITEVTYNGILPVNPISLTHDNEAKQNNTVAAVLQTLMNTRPNPKTESYIENQRTLLDNLVKANEGVSLPWGGNRMERLLRMPEFNLSEQEIQAYQHHMSGRPEYPDRKEEHQRKAKLLECIPEVRLLDKPEDLVDQLNTAKWIRNQLLR